MSRAFDVFLCHCGGGPGRVKELLDFVRRDLQALPSIDGSVPIRAFRDEDDLDRIGSVQDALHAAVHQAPIGVHRAPLASCGLRQRRCAAAFACPCSASV